MYSKFLQKAGGTEIKLNDHELKEVSYCKYLGVFVDSSLDWPPYIDHICKRTYPKLRLLNRLSCFLCSDVLIKIYKATILPILDYACIVWMDCLKNLSNKLERLQNQALRIIFCKNRRTCSQVVWDQVKILTLFNCRRLFRFITSFKIVNDINCPKQLQDKLIKRSSIRFLSRVLVKKLLNSLL